MRRHRAAAAITVIATAGLAACGSPVTPRPTGVAINPITQSGSASPGSPGASASSSASASATPVQQSGTRTVITPLGLNVRATPATDGAILGSAAQGTALTVMSYTTQNGGWFQVRGATTTGWINGDPSLSAPGQFTIYQSSAHGFNALYPVNWTFAEGTNNVTFRPQAGTEYIVGTSAASTATFGQLGIAGYAISDTETVLVCGVTVDMHVYARTPSATAPGLAYLAEVRFTANPSLGLAFDMFYDQPTQLPEFTNFYNSVSFMGPLCLFTPSPSASPKPT